MRRNRAPDDAQRSRVRRRWGGALVRDQHARRRSSYINDGADKRHIAVRDQAGEHGCCGGGEVLNRDTTRREYVSWRSHSPRGWRLAIQAMEECRGAVVTRRVLSSGLSFSVMFLAVAFLPSLCRDSGMQFSFLAWENSTDEADPANVHWFESNKPLVDIIPRWRSSRFGLRG